MPQRNIIYQDKIEEKPYVIGYIDLLGTKTLLNSKDSNKYINLYNIMYNAINDILDKIANDKGHFQGCGKIQSKIFSDNIVFAIEYNDYNSLCKNAKLLIAVMSMFQYAITCEQPLDVPIFVRGSICKGPLYWGENFILGSGLVTAYEMESKIAIYPRIIVEKELFKLINLIDEMIDNQSFMLTGDDGEIYLNYLTNITSNDIQKHYDKINFNNRQNNLKIKQKNNWLKVYHNRCCQATKNNLIFNDVANISNNNSSYTNDNHGVIGDVNGGTLRIQNGYDRPLSTQEQEILRIYNTSDAKTQIKIMKFMYEIETQR